jgi:hypothetical protein
MRKESKYRQTDCVELKLQKKKKKKKKRESEILAYTTSFCQKVVCQNDQQSGIWTLFRWIGKLYPAISYAFDCAWFMNPYNVPI